MGRFVGWIAPVAYLVAVIAGAGLCAWYTSFPGIGYWVSSLAGMFLGTTAVTQAALDPVVTCAIALGVVWVIAVLWFAWQAAVLHEGVEDERWTSHMLSVAMVSRVVLAPLGVFFTVSAALCIGAGIGAGVGVHAGMFGIALWTELLGIVVVLPGALYQACAATRLANRGLMGSTALAWNVVLAFMPTLGFVAMCGLYVNGREELLAAHDRRVVAEALEAAAATREETSEAEAPALLPATSAEA